MVYRGKPSAGCENCRRAKKKCGLEQPSCLRCVKLRKICIGYRDVSQLQFQDESDAVRRKAQRQNVKHASVQSTANSLAPPALRFGGSLTPSSTSSDSSYGTCVDSAFDDEVEDDPRFEEVLRSREDPPHGPAALAATFVLGLPKILRLPPDDVASDYFYYQFTSSGQWDHIRDYTSERKVGPCLEFALRACGMAALTNVRLVPSGKVYAQSNYVQALSLVNEALRDPKKSRSDETLIAVSMLAYYENIVCGSTQSSWQAHIAGATQMLKLRGRAQFKTHVGRILFRETRIQIVISCIGEDRDIPQFLLELQPELEARTTEDFHGLWKLADRQTFLWFRMAGLRKQTFTNAISPQKALEAAADLERDLIQWAVDAAEGSEYWRCYELDVRPSPHVWNGKVLAYAGNPAPVMMNQYRAFRILIGRLQEKVGREMSIPSAAREDQLATIRETRRQMADDICKTIPACLGHASPAFSSPCVLITAYASVWSLFFAATDVVERAGADAKYALYGLPMPPGKSHSAASAQLAWVMGRFQYISDVVGLKWAAGVAGILRGEARSRVPPAPKQNSLTAKPKHVPMKERALWLKNVEA